MNRIDLDTMKTSTQISEKFLVIKLGGNALVKDSALLNFCDSIYKLNQIGYKILITHGGGPQITTALQAAGVTSEFIDGFRYTSAAAIEIVKDVLCGEIQQSIIHNLRKSGVLDVVEICGDADVISAVIKTRNVMNEEIDLGLVGDVSHIDASKIISALEDGAVVVLSAIGKSSDGLLLNINADSAAAALAIDLNVDELILLTDVDGIFSDWPNQSSLVSSLSLTQAQELLPKLDAGMIPKLEAAITAITNFVPKVRILNGGDGQALLMSQLDNLPIGTVIS